MPFTSKAQRRYFYAKHPELAKKWEKHTPKGKKLPERARKKKLKKKAFLEGLFSVLVKEAADSQSTSDLILKIIRNHDLSGSDKNTLIATLKRQAAGFDEGPGVSSVQQSFAQRESAAGERNILSWDTLNRIFFGHPMFGDMRISDPRRTPEEEWQSPWKVTQT